MTKLWMVSEHLYSHAFWQRNDLKTTDHENLGFSPPLNPKKSQRFLPHMTSSWHCHYYKSLTLGRPGGVDATPPPLAFFPCNFFDDSNRKNRLRVSVTRDGRHILTYVTSSWRCHVTYVMTSYVHDGGQNTLFLPLFVNRDIFWCRCDKVMRLVSFSTKLRS